MIFQSFAHTFGNVTRFLAQNWSNNEARALIECWKQPFTSKSWKIEHIYKTWSIWPPLPWIKLNTNTVADNCTRPTNAILRVYSCVAVKL